MGEEGGGTGMRAGGRKEKSEVRREKRSVAARGQKEKEEECEGRRERGGRLNMKRGKRSFVHTCKSAISVFVVVPVVTISHLFFLSSLLSLSPYHPFFLTLPLTSSPSSSAHVADVKAVDRHWLCRGACKDNQQPVKL